MQKANKAAYLFAVGADGKVYHVNALPKSETSASFNAKKWLDLVSEVIGGKVSPCSRPFCKPVH